MALTTAQQIMKLSSNCETPDKLYNDEALEAFSLAEYEYPAEVEHNDETDQLKTTYIFDDGSKLVFSHNKVEIAQ